MVLKSKDLTTPSPHTHDKAIGNLDTSSYGAKWHTGKHFLRTGFVTESRENSAHLKAQK